MSFESFGSQIDEWPKLQDSIENQKTLDERVEEVKEEMAYATTLTKANDVLEVLELPDEQDDILRVTLLKIDDVILEDLSNKSKEEIQSFLFNQEEQKQENIDWETSIENEKNDKKLENINTQLEKINWVFTPEILANNDDIAQLLKIANDPQIESSNLDEISLKEKIVDVKDKALKDITNILKKPWKLESILDSIWWADPSNPQYQEFKEALISVDPSFSLHFSQLENIHLWKSLSTNDIVRDIENGSWWIIDLNLKWNPPNSTMSLIGSEYWFSEEIDLQALWELRNDIKYELDKFQSATSTLNDFNKSFNSLLWSIWNIWQSEDFKWDLQSVLETFWADMFMWLEDMYSDMDIPSEMQIHQNDLLDFNNIDSKNDLQSKIENTKLKIQEVNNYVANEQGELLDKYNWDIKELLQREPESKERQLEVLKFMKNSWFDMIPQELTDKLVRELQSNSLMISWMNLNPQNIDLKNWTFWESQLFRENGFNIEAKRNLLMFMNKMISWDINEPLTVNAIANWTKVVNPMELRHEFTKANIIWGTGWKYTQIIQNLKSNNKD